MENVHLTTQISTGNAFPGKLFHGVVNLMAEFYGHFPPNNIVRPQYKKVGVDLKNIILVTALILASTYANSENGLNIQYTIIKESLNGSSRERYINAVLIPFDKTSTFSSPNTFSLKFQVGSLEEGKADFIFTLKDLSTGNPYYIGAKPVEFKVGEAREIKFERNNQMYTIELDTSYGKLP